MSSANTFLGVSAVVASRTMHAVMELNERVAWTSASALITVAVNARIVAATNQDLDAAIKRKRFHDLGGGGGVTRRDGAQA